MKVQHLHDTAPAYTFSVQKSADECSKFPEPPMGHPPACTQEFALICGSDGESYHNLCLFCAAKRQVHLCLTNVRIYFK
uniref:Kazal-like domain-containing protein n=1 Tax=Salvator merianae TaxID=96440 RepID=A0A8D0B2L5_SALMN